jgi:ADP-ribosyl-[dinitrogen reductase] hydrolase
MSVQPVTAPTTPLRNSYWVLPGQLLAGEHPGGQSREDTCERLKRLLDAGVECFVDLTLPTETERYDVHLPLGIEYLRKPIEDHGIPQKRQHMEQILECVQDALREGRKAYVHCRAGIGRTGTVIGCLLVERGLSGDAALEELNRLFRQSERSKSWDWVPETDPQNHYVRTWTPRAATPEPHFQAVADADPLLEEATLFAAQGLRSRFHGGLAGLAIGDALAAATQYRRPGTFTPVGDLLGGGPFDLPRGGWSDDTAMALCLAESLLERNGFDAHDQVDRYRRWQREGYLSATGQCLGITAGTARALALAQWRRQAFSGSHDPGQLDPEPLSRVAPPTMFFFAGMVEASQQSGEAARTTCQAPAVVEACRTASRVLHSALSGQSKDVILAEAVNCGVIPLRAEPATAPTAGISAADAFAAALWAFATTDNFRDALLRAANLGGNSDVIAAVCGQLAGAHYTVAAIPAAWRNSLMQKDLIASFADRLLTHALVGLGG